MRCRLADWKRLLPLLLLLIGAGWIIVTLMVGRIGVGEQKALHRKQVVLALAGSVVLLSGAVLATPLGQRWLGLFAIDAQPANLLLIAVWFGVLTGWAEASVWCMRGFYRGEFIDMGVDFLWMVPLSALALFLALGLTLTLVDRLWPERVSLRIATFAYAFTSFWSVLSLWRRVHRYAALLLAAGLAVQTARIASRHAVAFHKLVRYTVGWPVILSHRRRSTGALEGNETTGAVAQPGRRHFLIGAGATIAAMAVGVHGWRAVEERRALRALPRASRHLPNVLLIVLDTVRAQSLSLYGYNRPTTPRLERLAKNGICFEQAIATSPWTLPTHASMFTGRWPHELFVGRWTGLDETWPTLAEVLSQHGYITAGFVANLSYCTRHHGLARGFAHYEDFPTSPGQLALSSSLGRAVASWDGLRNTVGHHEVLNRKPAAAVNYRFLSWLSRQEDAPFFVFLNYFDAHEPYLPPYPFDVMFRPKKRRGAFEHGPFSSGRAQKWKMSAEEIHLELDAYEGAIAYQDHQLGLLLDELEKQELLDSTLVIVTSDHGEEFGEHHVFGHGNSLYLPSVHVPLLLSLAPPVRGGRRIRQPVSVRDLPTTVLDLIGLSGSSDFGGESLSRYWDASRDVTKAVPPMPLSEVQKSLGGLGPTWYPSRIGAMKSLVGDGLHYIRNEGDGSEELYDIETDPWETRDLGSSEQGRRAIARLRRSLATILARAASGA